MANPTLNLLVQIQSDLAGLNSAVQGLQNLQNQANATAKSGFSLGDAFKFAGVEEGLRRAIDLVSELGGKMVDLAKESINAAAEIQQEKFFLTELIGSIERSNEILGGMHSLWQEIGIVSDEALTKAAQALAIINVPLENIRPMLIELSKIYAATNISLGDLVSGYQRVSQAIEHNNEAFVRGASAFGLASKELVGLILNFKGLENTSVGVATLGNMFKAGTITIQDFDDAIRKATTTGGQFDDAIEKRRALFLGAMDAMKIAWKEFEVEIGTPILDALTPFVNFATDVIKLFVKISEDHSWQDALRLAWSIVIQEIANLIVETFAKAWALVGEGALEFIKTLGATLQVFFRDGWKHGFSDAFLKAIGESMMEQIGEGIANSLGVILPEELAKERDKLKTTITGWWKSLFPGPDDLAGIDVTQPLEPGAQSKRDTGKVDMTRQLTAASKELEAALAAVHQQQTLISSQPLTGITEKDKELVVSYAKEIGDLQAGIDRLKRLSATGLLSKPQMEEVNVLVQKAGNQIDILKNKIAGLGLAFQTSLQEWANSFGSVGHQLGQTLQATVGAALQSINTFLVTGKFNAQALLQQIVMLGLQLVEQLAIQQVIGLINAHASTALAATTGAAIAASYAGAATAVTVASYGAAAAQAPGSIAAAYAAILATLTAGSVLHSGGSVRRRRMHSGGLAADEVPIIAQEGEIMIQRSVAQQPGMAEYLLGLNSGYYHQGGFVFGGRYHRGSDWGDDFNVWSTGPTLPPHWATNPTNPYGGPDFRGFSEYDPTERMTLERLAGFGFIGGIGTPGFLQGPTMIPTTFDSGGYPFAVQAALPPSDTGTSQQYHAGFQFKPKHTGGLIGSMHSGGSVGGGGGRGVGGGVHIYAFTDLKQLTKHMGSKEGQKIIFDTVKGRRIDLGFK